MTEHGVLDDRHVDELEPEVGFDLGSVRLRLRLPSAAPSGAQVVADVLSLGDLRDLAMLAGGVIDGHARFTDAGGFAIHGDEAVLADAAENEVRLHTAALRSLLARVVTAVIDRRAELASATDAATWDELERLGASAAS